MATKATAESIFNQSIFIAQIQLLEKKPLKRGFFKLNNLLLLIVAAESTQDMQQARENIQY